MNGRLRGFTQLVLALVILGGGVLALVRLTATRPQVKKAATAVPMPAVSVVTVATATRTLVIEAQGTVQPEQQIQLIPQVGGKILKVSPALVNGGMFEVGTELIRIDPADYALAITLAQAAVKAAESELSVIRQEAASAKEEWDKFFSRQAPERAPTALAMKQPQLAAAEARLAGVRADLERARLNLERTVIRAPFAGRVSAESVDIGQVVTPGQVLATIFSTAAAEIMVPLEDRDLAWLEVPGLTKADGPGSSALVRAVVAGRNREWRGRVVRAEGKIDERTRLVPLVVRVDHPYAEAPPLLAGLFVKVAIQGTVLTDTAVISRSLIRDGDLVWVLDQEQKIRFQPVTVARFSGNDAWVSGGLNNGDRLVATVLKTVTAGMRVRVLEPTAGEDRS